MQNIASKSFSACSVGALRNENENEMNETMIGNKRKIM